MRVDVMKPCVSAYCIIYIAAMFLPVVSSEAGIIAYWPLNDGSGQFFDSDLVLSEGFSSGIGLGDLDGDGDIDLFIEAYLLEMKERRNDVTHF